MISINQISKGVIIKIDDVLYLVTKTEKVKPGKGCDAFVPMSPLLFSKVVVVENKSVYVFRDTALRSYRACLR